MLLEKGCLPTKLPILRRPIRSKAFRINHSQLRRQLVRATASTRRITPKKSNRVPSLRLSVTKGVSHSIPVNQTELTHADRSPSRVQIAVQLIGISCIYALAAQCIGWYASTSPFASISAHGAEQGQCQSLSPLAMSLGSGMVSMPAWTGLSAGFLHTLAGPDHLAGLAPLTLGQKQVTAVSMGALWGFGHSSGQLLLGIIFLVLKERFQGIVPMLAKWAGVVVGLTLITIGIVGIYESRLAHHSHGEETETVMQVKGSMAKRSLGTYAIGFIYGLHPDALFVVLPALTLPTRLATLSYVVMFVIGTVCAMAGYTLAIGTASEVAMERRPWLFRHLSTLAASIALIVGVLVLLPSFGIPTPFA